MRREELSALGVELPVLATVVLGALPGDENWARRLASIGLDVVCSGADEDTPATWEEARAVNPYKPVKARSTAPAALVAAGCRIIECDGPVPGGAYRLGSDDAMVAVIDGGSAQIEDPARIARPIVEAARNGNASELWVVATAGLDRLDPEVVEAKLSAMVDSVVQARLALAKDQFEL